MNNNIKCLVCETGSEKMFSVQLLHKYYVHPMSKTVEDVKYIREKVHNQDK